MMVTESHSGEAHLRTARIWDVNTFRPVSTSLPLQGLNYGLSFDGKTAYTTDPKHVFVWDVKGSKLIWTRDLGQADCDTVTISPTGKEIAAVSKADGLVEVWEIGNDNPRLVIKQDAISADFDPTGTRIVTCDGNLHFYDVKSGRELFPAFYDNFMNVRRHFDSTGGRFLILEENNGARVIDTSTGTNLLRIKSKYNVRGAHWSVDSTKIILTTAFGPAQVFDALTGKLEQTISGDDILDLWVLNGDRWALCSRFKKPLEVWDLTTGLKVQTLDDSDSCEDPVKSTLVTEGKDGLLKLWRERAK
jgi:WD40 repeat protein